MPDAFNNALAVHTYSAPGCRLATYMIRTEPWGRAALSLTKGTISELFLS